MESIDLDGLPEPVRTKIRHAMSIGERIVLLDDGTPVGVIWPPDQGPRGVQIGNFNEQHNTFKR